MAKQWKIRDCHVLFLLAACVHHNISDQAVVLSSAGLQQESGGRGSVFTSQRLGVQARTK